MYGPARSSPVPHEERHVPPATLKIGFRHHGCRIFLQDNLYPRAVLVYDQRMKPTGSVQLLRNEYQVPDTAMLQRELGAVYPLYVRFHDALKVRGISLAWHYYHDVRSWLGKAVKEEKTICWISAWEGFFRTTFFVPVRYAGKLAELGIDSNVKETALGAAKKVSIPIVIDIRGEQDLVTAGAVTDFKLTVK